MKKAFLLAILLLVSLPGLGAGLEVSVDKRVIAVGQQLTLIIRAERLGAKLEQLDLQPLEGDFEIFDRAFLRAAERRGSAEVDVQTLELGLIALRSGRLTIPRLQIGGMHSLPLAIEVGDGSKEFPKVRIKSGFAEPRMYERNEATLFLDLYDDSTLQWRPPQVRARSMQLRPLASTSRFEQIGTQRYRVTRYAWGVMPLRSGNAVADFALIEATHFGQRIAFRAPAAIADVAGVPTYLPLTLHIGTLELANTIMPTELHVGRAEYRVIELRGRGLSVEGLRKSIVFPTSDDTLFFYKPQLTLVERNDGSQMVRVAQAFKPLREGDVSLPELRIPFYDPIRREVDAIAVAVRTLQASDPFYEKLRFGGLISTVAFALITLLWLRRERLRERFVRFRAMRRLSLAATATELLRELYAQKSLRDAASGSKALIRIEALTYSLAVNGDFKPMRGQLLREMKCGSREPRTKRDDISEHVFSVGKR